MPTQQLDNSGGSKISNAEWGLVTGATVCIDVVQALLDIVAIGVLVNRYIDIVVGMSLLFYFWIRGVKMDMKIIMSLVGAFFLEEIPGLDVLPLWTLDVLAVRRWDKADNKLPNLPI